jgi:hypothetical protein
MSKQIFNDACKQPNYAAALKLACAILGHRDELCWDEPDHEWHDKCKDYGKCAACWESYFIRKSEEVHPVLV